MKDSLIFFAFFSIPKLIFWQSSYVAQYPATTITMQLYINFDRQADKTSRQTDRQTDFQRLFT